MASSETPRAAGSESQVTYAPRLPSASCARPTVVGTAGTSSLRPTEKPISPKCRFWIRISVRPHIARRVCGVIAAQLRQHRALQREVVEVHDRLGPNAVPVPPTELIGHRLGDLVEADAPPTAVTLLPEFGVQRRKGGRRPNPRAENHRSAGPGGIGQERGALTVPEVALVVH